MRVKDRFIIEIFEGGSNFEKLIRRQVHENLTVDTGLNLIRDLIGGVAQRPDTIAVGTGTVTPVAADTALGTSVFSRTIDRRTKQAKIITHQIFITTAQANGNTLSETGLLQSAILVARSLIMPVIVKTSAIELTMAHELTLTGS